jgi:hypothetical protein
VTAAVLTSMTLVPTTLTPIAGTNLDVVATVLDQFGDVVSTYIGPECLSFAGPSVSPNGRAPNDPIFAPCVGGSFVKSTKVSGRPTSRSWTPRV